MQVAHHKSDAFVEEAWTAERRGAGHGGADHDVAGGDSGEGGY